MSYNQYLAKYPLLVPAVVLLISFGILWKAGYQTVWKRMTTEVIGTVETSQDFPSHDAPGYATIYTMRDPYQQEFQYVAGADDGSLERSLPPQTKILKEKWRLGYHINDDWIGFSTLFYFIIIVGAFCGLVWSARRLFLNSQQRQKLQVGL